MDLDPVTGQYRFTASVPCVEMNDLRRTLGIKPLPMPIGGALRGVLHCTGALEQPVFSGKPTHSRTILPLPIMQAGKFYEFNSSFSSRFAVVANLLWGVGDTCNKQEA